MILTNKKFGDIIMKSTFGQIGMGRKDPSLKFKIVDNNGKTIKVYKDTFDPLGNLVHRKDK